MKENNRLEIFLQTNESSSIGVQRVRVLIAQRNPRASRGTWASFRLLNHVYLINTLNIVTSRREHGPKRPSNNFLGISIFFVAPLYRCFIAMAVKKDPCSRNDCSIIINDIPVPRMTMQRINDKIVRVFNADDTGARTSNQSSTIRKKSQVWHSFLSLYCVLRRCARPWTSLRDVESKGNSKLEFKTLLPLGDHAHRWQWGVERVMVIRRRCGRQTATTSAGPPHCWRPHQLCNGESWGFRGEAGRVRIVGTEECLRVLLLLFIFVVVLPPAASAVDSHLCCATLILMGQSAPWSQAVPQRRGQTVTLLALLP